MRLTSSFAECTSVHAVSGSAELHETLILVLTYRQCEPFHLPIVLVSDHIVSIAACCSLEFCRPAYLIFLTKFQRSQKCWTRSTTLGPAKVRDVSCHAIFCQLDRSSHEEVNPTHSRRILNRQGVGGVFPDRLKVHDSRIVVICLGSAPSLPCVDSAYLVPGTSSLKTRSGAHRQEDDCECPNDHNMRQDHPWPQSCCPPRRAFHDAKSNRPAPLYPVSVMASLGTALTHLRHGPDVS